MSGAQHQRFADRPKRTRNIRWQGHLGGAERIPDHQPASFDDLAPGGLTRGGQPDTHEAAIGRIALQLDQPAIFQASKEPAGRWGGHADALTDALHVGSRLLFAHDAEDPPLREGEVFHLTTKRAGRDRDAPEDDPFDRVHDAFVSVHRSSDRLARSHRMHDDNQCRIVLDTG